MRHNAHVVLGGVTPIRHRRRPSALVVCMESGWRPPPSTQRGCMQSDTSRHPYTAGTCQVVSDTAQRRLPTAPYSRRTRVRHQPIALGSDIHVMLAKRFRVTVGQSRFPSERRSTVSHGHAQGVSTRSGIPIEEQWPQSQRQTAAALPRRWTPVRPGLGAIPPSRRKSGGASHACWGSGAPYEACVGP